MTDDPQADSFGSGWIRTVRDVDGRTWRLWEFVARTALAPARAPALLADGDAILRRIEDFPPDWPTLTDGELLALIHAPAAERGRAGPR